MKEQMNKEKEQSRIGKNLRKSLIRNKRPSVKQLTRAKKGSKRGSSVKKKLSSRKSRSRNLRKLCRRQRNSKRLQTTRATKKRSQKSKSNSLFKLTKNLLSRMTDQFGKGLHIHLKKSRTLKNQWKRNQKINKFKKKLSRMNLIKRSLKDKNL
jgi:hypothetical protein